MSRRVCSILSPPISKTATGALQTWITCRPTPLVLPAGITPGEAGVMPARLAAERERMVRAEPVSKRTSMSCPFTAALPSSSGRCFEVQRRSTSPMAWLGFAQ